MPSNTRQFSDLDLNFTAHPVTGDIGFKYDENAVKQSVKNLVLTQNFERPFHSEIGSTIRSLLFEPATPMTKEILRKTITDTITNFEPRVELLDVLINYRLDNVSVDVKIKFKIRNTFTPIDVSLILERTR
jgi:phage baseplate assembly protein W|tara:strand:- start:19442 stop:19834 length:393 start_codon:yes stop_codon:yes gene_type:complete